jgi:hypothetical protein
MERGLELPLAEPDQLEKIQPLFGVTVMVMDVLLVNLPVVVHPVVRAGLAETIPLAPLSVSVRLQFRRTFHTAHHTQQHDISAQATHENLYTVSCLMGWMSMIAPLTIVRNSPQCFVWWLAWQRHKELL